ncbi:uncharacterized protein LOC119690146 isoform X2 [Teleopsis dalmanni]|uniref:uncharacterized protein LOC119690146 isoform X2 n=1 Tax=Teleopsis dalmanni TaxID=139649 RepID=UPI0018CC9FEE|nr:uncharacterized protein LOC119690146 isoform X2 [Teleopsis dalmanni]
MSGRLVHLFRLKKALQKPAVNNSGFCFKSVNSFNTIQQSYSTTPKPYNKALELIRLAKELREKKRRLNELATKTLDLLDKLDKKYNSKDSTNVKDVKPTSNPEEVARKTLEKQHDTK